MVTMASTQRGHRRVYGRTMHTNCVELIESNCETRFFSLFNFELLNVAYTILVVVAAAIVSVRSNT